MKSFGPYEDLMPTFGRPDVFIGTRRYSADVPHAMLLLFVGDNHEAVNRALFAVRHLTLKVKSQWVLPLVDFGKFDERYAVVMSLVPPSRRIQLERLTTPPPREFWLGLARAMEELHTQGLFRLGLSPDTVAIDAKGQPVLFDLLGAAGATSQNIHARVAAD